MAPSAYPTLTRTVAFKAVSILLTVALVVVATEGYQCTSGYMLCPASKNSECITMAMLCDGKSDCINGGDESRAFCDYFRNDCTRGNVRTYQYGCKDWTRACIDNRYLTAINTTICEMINGRTLADSLAPQELPTTPAPPAFDMAEVATFLAGANCSTLQPTGQHSCPFLYTNVSNTCIALLPFALSWPEAAQACQSINGALAEFDDVEVFAEVLQYLIQNDFSSNFWTGGLFNIKKEAWTWASGRPIPQGSPYWTLKYTSACIPRESKSLGTHQGCYNYHQAPSQEIMGYCAALQFQFMYYMSDEDCFSRKRPLCMVN